MAMTAGSRRPVAVSKLLVRLAALIAAVAAFGCIYRLKCERPSSAKVVAAKSWKLIMVDSETISTVILEAREVLAAEGISTRAYTGAVTKLFVPEDCVGSASEVLGSSPRFMPFLRVVH